MKPLANIGEILRGSDWWNYKLPPLFAVAYWGMYQSGAGLCDGMLRLALLSVWMVGAAGFGHYLNDWSDVEPDFRAGKSNAAASHGLGRRVSMLLVLAAAALLPWVWLAHNAWAWWPVVAQLLLFAGYSVFPRLKEFAYCGIIADALYAHVLPTAIVLLPFWGGKAPAHSGFVCALGAWAFFYGLRNILGHQISDFENDLKSGTLTHATEKGPEASAKLIRTFAVLEIGGFVLAWLLGGFPFCMAVPAAFALFTAYRWWLYRHVWMLPFGGGWGVGAYNSFLNNFYELYFPLAVLAAASAQTPAFALLIPLHLGLFAKNTSTAAAEWRNLSKRQE